MKNLDKQKERVWDNLIEKSKDIDSEYVDIVNQNFWDLI